MSTPPASDEPLQFDEADYGAESPVGLACGACAAPIRECYYETAGKVVCEPCRGRIEAALQGGSRLARLFKATALGTIAAAVGAGLYYAIVRLTDYNIGIIAIVIGVMVGGAVRAGSGGRGGRLYQFLALFLTYTAIAGMLAPFLVADVMERQEQEEKRQVEEFEALLKTVAESKPIDAQKADAEKAGAQAEPDVAADDAKPADAPAADAAPETVAESEPADAPATEAVADQPPVDPDEDDGDDEDVDLVFQAPTPGAVALAVAVLIAFCYAMPVLVTFGSPISGLIFGYGMWVAWKINRKEVVAFNGPFHVLPPDAIVQDDEEDANDGPDEGDRHGA